MNKNRTTLSEFLLYWEPQERDRLAAFIAGAYLASLALVSII